MHKNKPWQWPDSQDRTVFQVNDALANAPVSTYLDTEKNTDILVDASPVGLTAILSQGLSETYAS